MCTLPEPLSHVITGAGKPSAKQSMRTFCPETTEVSRGSTCHRGGTAKKTKISITLCRHYKVGRTFI